MIKKEIYPKTKRISCEGERIYITEKLDGSNLVIFKKEGVIYIAQRKNIMTLDEAKDFGQGLYKGLLEWLEENKDYLDDIYEGSAVCGEWLGMGKIKYDTFDKKFYMFAKARVNDDFSLSDFQYDHAGFFWVFNSQVIPDCIGIVPEVEEITILPNKEYLDDLYTRYTEKVGRVVEGFVINYQNHISKYVRMKDGKLRDYFDRE